MCMYTVLYSKDNLENFQSLTHQGAVSQNIHGAANPQLPWQPVLQILHHHGSCLHAAVHVLCETGP